MDTAWTTDSLAGYDMAVHTRYDLYVIDVRMPGLLGTELVAGLKEAYLHAKILPIPSFADAALRQTARHLDVPLLSKPFTPTQFLAEIASVLRSAP